MPGLDDAIGDLFVKVRPDTQGFGADVANQTASQTNRALGGVQKGSRVALGVVTAVGAGLAAVGAEADAAFDDIRVGTGATGEALEGLEGDFKSLLSEVPATAADAGTAIANLNTALGVSGADAVLLGENFLELSRITGTDLETNIASATEALNNFQVGPNFGDSAEETEGYLNDLFRVSQATGVGVDELGNQLSRSGAQFRAVGLNISESAALVGALGKAGIDATQVVPGLTRVLKDAADEGISAEDALANVSKAIQGAETDAEAAEIAFASFGTRGGAVLGEQIRNGSLDLETLTGLFEDSSDSILDAAEDTKSLQEQFLQLKNKVFVALEPAATKLFEGLGDSLGDIAPALVLVVEALVPLIEIFASLPAPVQASLVGLLAVGSVIGKLAGPIGTAIKLFKTLSLVVAANPWVLLIAATVALAVVIYKNWDSILAFLKKVWAAIVQAFDATVGALKSAAGAVVEAFVATKDAVVGAFNTMVDALKTAANAVVEFFKQWGPLILAVITGPIGLLVFAVVKYWDQIMAATSAAWNAILGAVKFVADLLVQTVTMMGSQILGVLQAGWNVLRDVTQTVWDAIMAVIQNAVEGALFLFDSLVAGVQFILDGWGNLLSLASTVWDAVAGFVVEAVDKIIGALSTLKGAASDALGPVGDVISKGGSILGKIPGFDEGGVVPGPRGSPQLIMAHGGETIFPTHKTPIPTPGTAMRGVAGGDVIVNLGGVTIANDMDVVDVGRRLGREAKREMEARGE